MTTTNTATSPTPEQIKPHAMRLLIDLGDAIGDRDAIREAIDSAIEANPQTWPMVAISALAWTFAEHARLDPDWTPRQEATA